MRTGFEADLLLAAEPIDAAMSGERGLFTCSKYSPAAAAAAALLSFCILLSLQVPHLEHFPMLMHVAGLHAIPDINP